MNNDGQQRKKRKQFDILGYLNSDKRRKLEPQGTRRRRSPSPKTISKNAPKLSPEVENNTRKARQLEHDKERLFISHGLEESASILVEGMTVEEKPGASSSRSSFADQPAEKIEKRDSSQQIQPQKEKYLATQSATQPTPDLFARSTTQPDTQVPQSSSLRQPKYWSYSNRFVPILHSDYVTHSSSTEIVPPPHSDTFRYALEILERGITASDLGLAHGKVAFGRDAKEHEYRIGPTIVFNDVDLYLCSETIYVATERGLLTVSDYLDLIGIPQTQKVRFNGRMPPWAKKIFANAERRVLNQCYRCDTFGQPLKNEYGEDYVFRKSGTVDIYKVVEQLEEYNGIQFMRKWALGTPTDNAKVVWFPYDITDECVVDKPREFPTVFIQKSPPVESETSKANRLYEQARRFGKMDPDGPEFEQAATKLDVDLRRQKLLQEKIRKEKILNEKLRKERKSTETSKVGTDHATKDIGRKTAKAEYTETAVEKTPKRVTINTTERQHPKVPLGMLQVPKATSDVLAQGHVPTLKKFDKLVEVEVAQPTDATSAQEADVKDNVKSAEVARNVITVGAIKDPQGVLRKRQSDEDWETPLSKIIVKGTVATEEKANIASTNITEDAQGGTAKRESVVDQEPLLSENTEQLGREKLPSPSQTVNEAINIAKDIPNASGISINEQFRGVKRGREPAEDCEGPVPKRSQREGHEATPPLPQNTKVVNNANSTKEGQEVVTPDSTKPVPELATVGNIIHTTKSTSAKSTDDNLKLTTDNTTENNPSLVNTTTAIDQPTSYTARIPVTEEMKRKWAERIKSWAMEPDEIEDEVDWNDEEI